MLYKSKFLLIIVVINLTLITACSQAPKTEIKPKPSTPGEPGFTLNDATLEQADQQGKKLWKVKAKKAVYSQDKKTAKIDNVEGEFYQDNQVVIKIKADQGEAKTEGQQVFLTGNIVATDPRNGIILKGNEAEWNPKKELLIMRNNLIINREKMQITAQEGVYFPRQQQTELFKKIVGTMTEPSLDLKTEHLIWQVALNKITGDQPILITQFKDKKMTNQARGNWSQIDLKTNIVLVQKNVKLDSVDPPIEITGNSMLWNLTTKMINSDQPANIFQIKQNLKLTANNSVVDLEKQIAYLTNGVEGFGGKNQSQISSKDLTWFMKTQEFIALGNVNYSQLNPPFNLTGVRAVGKLQGDQIIVRGEAKQRVITNIIP